MKTWYEFGSSHSWNVAIIGQFENNEKAKEAFGIVEDITLASWEQRYPSVKKFEEKWKDKYPWIPYRVTQEEFETGVDNTPDIEISGNKITISSIRTSNIGGILKVLFQSGAIDINIKK